MPERELVNVHLRAEERLVGPVLRMVHALGLQEGLPAVDCERLELAVGEACVNVVVHAFHPGERSAALDVQVLRRPGQFVVAVCDKGLPFDPVHESRFGAGLLEHLVDEVRFRNLGPAGRRVELVKNLPYRSGVDLLSEETKSIELVPAPADAPVEIRLMRPDESMELARCVYYSYGYSYVGEFVYFPERVREMLETGKLVSLVAATPTGEIVGHVGLNLPSQGGRVAEVGQAMVDPRYRGHHFFETLKVRATEEASARGLWGLYSTSVTVHPFTQMANLALGGCEVGLLLGYAPATLEFRKIEGGRLKGRQAVMLMYCRTGQEPERTVHVPARDRDAVEEIYAAGGFRRSFAEGRPAGGPTELDVEVHAGPGIAALRVLRWGADARDQLHLRTRQLCLQRIAFLELDMPLGDPGTPTGAEAARSLGFFFGGVIPELADGDVLRYQYLDNVEVDPARIHTASDRGRRLLERVLGEMPT